MSAKREVLGNFTGKITSLDVKEFTPQGVRAEVTIQGSVTGKYSAIHFETVNALLKPDGNREGESRAIEFTKDGDTILITSKLTGRMVDQARRVFESEVTYQTRSKKLAWLNSTKGLAEGQIDLATGTTTGKTYIA